MARAVFLFGAGASYGSDKQGVPPFGAELFNELQRFNSGGWDAVPADVATCFREDFEAGMREFSSSYPAHTDILQRAMAAYFFRFQPQPTSLYVNLARRIQTSGWDGALATLNYERLIWSALRAARIQFNVAGLTSPSNAPIELCLPHGCCHLFGQIRISGNITLGPRIRLDSPEIRVIENAQEHAKELEENAVPPVMSYFQPDKETRSGVSFIKGQRDRFAALVREASTVAIIGMRVRPRDKHIWDPVIDTPARIIYCAGPDAGDEYQAWADKCRPHRHDEVLRGWFREEFDALCDAVALPKGGSV